MKKITILLIGIILLISLVWAIKISTFENGTDSFNVTVITNESHLVNLSVPRYCNITYFTFNLTNHPNFSDNFNRPNGYLENGWNVIDNSNPQLSANITDNKMLFHDVASATLKVNRTIFPNPANISLDFYSNSSDNYNVLSFLLTNSTGSISIFLIKNQTVLSYQPNDTTTIPISQIAPDTWIGLSIRNINYTSKKFDLYLNNTLFNSSLYFYNNLFESDTFELRSSVSLTVIDYIDNFTLDYMNPLNPYITLNNTLVWNYTGNFSLVNNMTSNLASILNSAIQNGRCNCRNCTLVGTNCSVPLEFYSESHGVVELFGIELYYEPIPFIYLKVPGNITYASSSKEFTCNSTDELNLKNTTLYIWNSTSIINNTEYRIISGTSNSSSYNITFPRSDTYYWNCLVYNNNSYPNWHEENYTLYVDITNPTITLNFPSNNSYLNNGTNIYFNYTPEHPDGLDTCQLWGNWTGSYIKNDTDVTISNLSINSFVKNISDGKYKYTIWCNSTSGNSMLSQYGNYTFGIDTILPIANNMTISTTASQTQFTFLSNITDTNLANCWYSIWSGSIPGFTNTSFTCNSLTTANAPGFGTYILFLFANDSAGNFVQQNLSFTTSVTATISGGGGGGSPSTTTVQEEPTKLFSLLNTNLENRLNLQLAKDSTRPREKTLVLINRAKKPITVKLSCDMTDVNKSSREIDVCAYVKFANETLILNANEDTPTETTLYLYTPDYSNFGENYYFNVLATDISTKGYSKLSVSSKVNILSTILYKWSDRITFKSFDYPVFLVSIIVSTLILILSIMVFQRANPKLILTGLLVGFALFFGTLLLFTLYLF